MLLIWGHFRAQIVNSLVQLFSPVFFGPVLICAAFFCLLSFFLPNCADAQALDKTDKPIIRTITIQRNEIFEGSDLAAFYRWANSIKISTKEEVISRELLIKEGDKFDEFLLQESERILRSLSFIRRASITPLRDGDYVDILVSVQDTWTLFPTIGFSSGGGTSKQEVGLVENNLLGYGKRAEVLYADDEGRDSYLASYSDRRVLGSSQRLIGNYLNRTDGYGVNVDYGKPFRSLVDKFAWNTNFGNYDLVGKLYENGDESFIYREMHDLVNFGVTISSGEPEELRRRYSFGYEFVRDKFQQADEQDFIDVDVDPDSVSQDPALLAEDRRFSGPFVAYQQIEPDFLSINYVDRFERVEDFNLGNQFNSRLQVAPEFLDSIEDSLRMFISDSDGLRLSPTSFMRGEIGAGTRATSGDLDDSVIEIVGKYYNVSGAKFLNDIYLGRHTFVASTAFIIGERLDKDRQFLLGAENGLRGYDDRTFSGDHRALLNLEDRFFLYEDVLKLVNIGGAFFLDVGGTSEKNLGDLMQHELYSDVGFGFRFGFPRASGGTVLRIDFAIPLRNGPDGTDKYSPQVLFTAGQLVTAQLPNESSGVADSNFVNGFGR